MNRFEKLTSILMVALGALGIFIVVFVLSNSSIFGGYHRLWFWLEGAVVLMLFLELTRLGKRRFRYGKGEGGVKSSWPILGVLAGIIAELVFLLSRQ